MNSSFICDVCPKSFASFSNLKRHKIIHLPYNCWPFECDHCNKRFTQKTILNTHKKKHFKKKSNVRNRNNLDCKLCNRMFKYQKSLDKHIRNVHKSVKMFKCLECHKRFGNKKAYQNHIQSCYDES